ncbi:MAG: DASS family sodium-coupled anion symporter [Candidatus Kapaibacteriota bacterium]
MRNLKYKGTDLKANQRKFFVKPKVELSFNFKRWFYALLGFGCFLLFYFLPNLPSFTDPLGRTFHISFQGKLALGLFLWAGVWWVFEVVPIGITSILIGVVQVLFLIREPRVVFTDFFDPSVWFIFGSLVIGISFQRTGITQRIAYRMLKIVGEKTTLIYLGSFIIIGILTLIMAHTAVAAAVYPILMTIHTLYEENDVPTKFGKGLFIGMAYSAGAGSIVTLLGSARAPAAIGIFKEITTTPGIPGREISFFELTFYMLPIGWLMILIIWVYISLVYKPERSRIEGLKERIEFLSQRLGKFTKNEIITLIVVLGSVSLLILRSFIPELKFLDKSAVMLLPTIFLFLLNILKLKDLEDIPWNIILLFGGAMCIGFCLWQTGAANWLAVGWLVLFKNAPWLVFVISIAFFVLLLTNFIMNVAAIAITMPISFVMGKYIGVAPEVILFASLVAAGMPFLLLIGAAPNAIAYESKQFTSGEFFRNGVVMSIILMIVLSIFVAFLWPMMGMPVFGN